MSSFDIKDLTGPFLKAFQSEIGLDKAAEIAAFNMMMTYLQDRMAKMATKHFIAKFLFTGFIGSILTSFVISPLLSFIAREGENFATLQVHQWHMNSLEKAYLFNMNVYNQNIEALEFITEAQKEAYKKGVKDELKKFFNLSRFLKS